MKIQEVSLSEDKDKLKRVSRLMKTVGHPSRLMIVELLLTQGKLPVREISEAIDISQSNTSQHLKALEDIEVLFSEREGTSVYYGILNTGISKLLNCVQECTTC
jgi:DNA-binding transcriptional ArsR family regulator